MRSFLANFGSDNRQPVMEIHQLAEDLGIPRGVTQHITDEG